MPNLTRNARPADVFIGLCSLAVWVWLWYSIAGGR